MQIPNPETRVVTQLNNSDYLGDLWSSFNLDLSENEGLIRVGKRLILNTNSSDVAEITSYPAAFKVFGGSKFAIAGASATGYVFSNGNSYPSSASFSKVAAANSPAKVDSEYSDMEISNGILYVTQNDSNVAWTSDGSTWGTVFAAGNAATPHMLTSFGGRTYMSDLLSKVISWDSSNSVATSGQYTLQLGNSNSNVITFLRSSSNRIWIGTVNTTGGKGHIYEWDGSSSQPTKSYRLEASGALACVIKNDIPYVVDSNGDLLVWNSGNFQKIAGFNRRRNKLLFNPLSSKNNRFIHPNGMSIVKGKINILIDGRNYDNSTASTSLEETIPSGIWEYDPNKGLYHKHSFGLSKAGATITDYGQARIAGAGALAELNMPSTTSTRNGTLLAGATYYTTATVTASGIFFDDSNDTEQKAGYLVTTKRRPRPTKSGPVLDAVWRKVFLTYRKFLNSSSKIVIKYRQTEAEPVEVTGTWTSTTTFTTTGAVSSYEVGDEVEVVAGSGAGTCAHITEITESGGTYTVTVDEAIVTLATAKIRFQKWKKLGSISDQISTWKEFSVNEPTATWIQFKVWMKFTGREELENLIAIDTQGRTAE